MIKRVRLILVIASVLIASVAFAQEPILWQAPKELDNAAPLYFRAFLTVRPVGFDTNKAEWDAAARLEKDGVYDARSLDPLIDRNATALDLLHQAAGIDRCDFGIQYSEGLRTQFPELTRARQLADVAVLAMHKSGTQGHWSAAAATFEDLLHMVRHIHQNGTLIHALVAMNITDKPFHEASWLLSGLPADDGAYGRLIEALAAAVPVVANTDVVFNNEICFFTPYAPPPGTAWAKEQLTAAFSSVFGAFSEGNKSAPLKPGVYARIASGTATPEEQQSLAQLLQCAPQELMSPANLSMQLTRQMEYFIRGLRQAQALMKEQYLVAKPQLDVLDAVKGPEVLLLHLVYPDLSKLKWANTGEITKLDLIQAVAMVLRWRLGQHTLPQDITQVPGIPTDPFTLSMPFRYQAGPTGGFTVSSQGADQGKPDKPLSLAIK